MVRYRYHQGRQTYNIRLALSLFIYTIEVIFLARRAREKSSTGIYHVMIRGINRQAIFEDDEDRMRFIDTLREYKDISKYEIYGYCLMNNHVHLLIKERDEPISLIIKRICSSYVYWYNTKYERCGHLFQERFKSEVVEDDGYFLTVLRYIHQNPVKARIAENVSQAKWTSYKEYVEKARFVDIDFGLNYFSKYRAKAILRFIEFMNKENEDKCLDYLENIRLSDDEVRDHIKKLGIINSTAFQQLGKEKRDEILGGLKKMEGVTVRQIARVTGISKSVIDRA